MQPSQEVSKYNTIIGVAGGNDAIFVVGIAKEGEDFHALI
jgi:hypothetical protein